MTHRGVRSIPWSSIARGARQTCLNISVSKSRVTQRDGINGFAEAKARGLVEGIFRVANLRDIIASKRASGRKKDRIELPLMESFKVEYEKRHLPPLRSAADITAKKQPRK
jgi:hypothetical protein